MMEKTRAAGVSLPVLLAAASVLSLSSGCAIRVPSPGCAIRVSAPPRPAAARNTGRLTPAAREVSRDTERPVVNLPRSARQRNWTRNGGGSCVIASTVSLFRWQGRDDLAELFRRKYGGGHSSGMLNSHFEAHRVRYAYTTTGDVGLLEWACRTRRGCGIGYYPNHFICLVDLTPSEAWLLDNNRTGRYIRVPRGEFIRNWKRYGGWAAVPVYSPAPAKPWAR